MRTLIALCLIAAIVFIVSCQQPAQMKADMEKQTEQIKMLEEKIDALNTKIEQLMTNYKKHLDDFHQKSSKGKKLPAMGLAPTDQSLPISDIGLIIFVINT